jgi:UDP-N-acetylmuramyl pentapeptide phosphotransferase/UDP-N-acetylglucosamine-1-phosphate transferase
MTNAWLWPLIVFVGTAIAATVTTRLVLIALQRRAILDHPNERSSHALPTPRGGGIAVVAVLVASWALIHHLQPVGEPRLWLVIGGILALAALSWLDDLYSLSAGLRIVCHAVVVAIVLATLPDGSLIFQGILPPLLDRIAAGLLWIWFINLFNFMDGIDGISGVEALSIGLGLAAIAAVSGDLALREDAVFAIAVAGTALGFLVWNWHPARLFLGDVGSVPLGFALGWLLLDAAIAGYWAAAIILPLYYLADATITLTRRALRGAKIWQAHREHFYQQAAAQGRSHAAVVCAIAIANLILIGSAIVAEHAEGTLKIAALVVAVVAIAILLGDLSGRWRAARKAERP